MLILAGCSDSPTGPSGGSNTEPGEPVPVTVRVIDDFDLPVIGAKVYTSPETEIAYTDENGIAVLNCPRNVSYYFRVKCGEKPIVSKIVLVQAGMPPVVYVFPNQSPQVTIVFPQNNQFVSNVGMTFMGSVTDAEDSTFAAESLEWTSDIDGFLGNGSEITVQMLTGGRHHITFRASDSRGVTANQVIEIMVVQYNISSYFPLPFGGTWRYEHDPDQITVINDSGQEEIWKLYDIDVTIDTQMQRTSKMNYDLIRVSGTKNYHYEVTDAIVQNGERITIERTTEELSVYSSTTGNNWMHIETVYSPPLILMEDSQAPADIPDQAIHLDVNWIDALGRLEFTESFTVTCSVTAGAEEQVTTVGGTFTALPLTIVQGNADRTWWLAPSIGVVRIMYNSFADETVAGIATSNLSGISKPRYRVSAPRPALPGTIIDMPLPAEDGPERERAVVAILRALSPVAPLGR